MHTTADAARAFLAVVVGWFAADLGSGLYHWAMDNYGDSRTPIVVWLMQRLFSVCIIHFSCTGRGDRGLPTPPQVPMVPGEAGMAEHHPGGGPDRPSSPPNKKIRETEACPTTGDGSAARTARHMCQCLTGCAFHWLSPPPHVSVFLVTTTTAIVFCQQFHAWSVSMPYNHPHTYSHTGRIPIPGSCPDGWSCSRTWGSCSPGRSTAATTAHPLQVREAY